MAEYNNVYQRAIYYDIVFNRDVSQEAQFIQDVYHYYTGGQLRSVLDLACGPGYHARAFAKRGVRAVGLDLRGEMLAFAREQAEAEGVSATWVKADMRYVQLDAPVDAAISMFDGIDALLTNEDIIAHFQAMAHNLTPGGIYLLQSTHPADCFYGNYGRFHYEGERDGISVEINWAINNPQFDFVTGVGYVEIEMRINDHGEAFVIHDAAQERMLTPNELALMAELSGGLRVVGWYGDFKLSQLMDNSPASQKMIVVMQKKD